MGVDQIVRLGPFADARSVPCIEQLRIVIKKFVYFGACLQFTRHKCHQNEDVKNAGCFRATARSIISKAVAERPV